MLRDTIVDGAAKTTGDKVTTSDETGITLCSMGKARLAAEKATQPVNRDDASEKLTTR